MNDDYKPKGGKKAKVIRHKGFYAALYSCVGVMLVLAVIIGYNNFRPKPVEDGAEPGVVQEPLDFEQALNPDEGASGLDGDSQAVSSGDEPGQAADPPLNQDGAQTGIEPYEPPEDDVYSSAGEQLSEGGTDPSIDPNAEAGADGQPLSNEEDLEAWRRSQPTPEPPAPPEPTPTGSSYLPFDELTESMAWPVLGDIVMKYSVDHLVYDPTLEQYRTNNNICISAMETAPVKAAAAGTITDVFTTRENGRTVVVDHGNGWMTTYSQLQDSVLVQVGDVVEKGQSIGEVGTPSMFSSQLGSHLAFTVQKDDVPVDPYTILQ
ncbi:MAG: M23 family metallopeptidase [Clostridiales bacterium]|jgi:murein DD-endopeptidase MepM/ murein hydrolase activator NlpD|nr:M23 family metallopeptidase [Clostridiales bacterium]